MKRYILPMGIVLIGFVVPSSAAAKPPTSRHAREYNRLYHQVAKQFGRRAPGRNIMKNGYNDHRGATDKDVVKSIGVLKRFLAPPPSPSISTTTPIGFAPVAIDHSVTIPVPTTQASSGGGGTLPYCTWGPESGGDWTAVNSSSGAYGRYQILPSTAAANGCDLSTHQGQTNCATTIYAGGKGASQWVNC